MRTWRMNKTKKTGSFNFFFGLKRSPSYGDFTSLYGPISGACGAEEYGAYSEEYPGFGPALGM